MGVNGDNTNSRTKKNVFVDVYDKIHNYIKMSVFNRYFISNKYRYFNYIFINEVVMNI